ncbi:Epidermal growth factor receptor kinase substrate 8-like protein 1 [Triplophysa tibetana]|uniref:Epidermal growth factor receptor kinase substrate 8-like protein 1 n=1 Tax=Triplophysa tibetana TaxID=1572043 RepID=A0A5A9N7W8_9TELE|nr:Epidermal growth factor receptor kinase substrate 8-like protein 1 [Triplophysa tibetana]
MLFSLQRLVKFSLGDEGVDTVEEALPQVHDLLDHYQMSSVEVILEIRADRVSLRDRNNQDLETFALSSLLRCDCVYSASLRHPSLLLLVCQSSTQKRPSVYLFSCTTFSAERIRDDIKQVVSHRKIRENRFVESSMDISGVPSPPYSQAPNPPSNHPPPPYPGIRANGMVNGQPDKSFLKAQVEVDLLNHCFDDMEVFMGKLQQSAEAQMILNQRSKKKKRSQKKSADEDLLTAKAKPPFEKEFIDTFQKFKYSFSLLARLKSSISNPTSYELLHHVFKPLDMVSNNNLTTQEQELWTLLGPNWTQHRSALRSPVAPYTPTFLDGWRPPGSDVAGWVDPVEIQHKQDAELSKVEVTNINLSNNKTTQQYTRHNVMSTVNERSYRCSYDFVARNSSELSVLQGETLEVIEASKRWWKCRNKFNEVGFVPFNLLEPITHIDNPVMRRTPKPPAAPPISNSLPMPSAVTSDPSSPRPRSMVLGSQHLPEDTEKGTNM